MKKLFFFLFLFIFVGAKELKIGVVLPLSGIFQELGNEAKKGLQIAYDATPTLYDYEIKLIIKDNQSDKVETISVTKKLIQEEEVTALIGGIASSNAFAIANLANRFKIPFIAIGATNANVTLYKKYAFRVCFSDPYQGEMIAKWALDNNLTTAAVISFENSSFSKEIAFYFKKFYLKNGGKIIKSFSFSNDDAITKEDFSILQEESPAVIVLTGYYPNALNVLKILKKMQISSKIVSSDALHYQEFLDEAKDDANGVVVVGYFNPNNANTQEAKEFATAYKLKYMQEVSYYAALGADSYNMLIEAIQKCIESGKGAQNPRCINDNLRDLKNFSAITGIISIDKNGNVIKPIVFDVVKDGIFTYLQTIYPPQPKKEKK